ncbi:hypothetical protein ACFYXH_22330 [Streptomyces sp. NPDC002730]|uniref:hypothetical protein n=1 Tax=Streptomyces sp. NPDC002730 TaxID=3364662 RepID=UPI003676F476
MDGSRVAVCWPSPDTDDPAMPVRGEQVLVVGLIWPRTDDRLCSPREPAPTHGIATAEPAGWV